MTKRFMSPPHRNLKLLYFITQPAKGQAPICSLQTAFRRGFLSSRLRKRDCEDGTVESDPPNRQLTVDLERQQVAFPSGDVKPFTIPLWRREALLEGLDEIQLTLKEQPRIPARH
jgi:3-isopropylmalate dehydratase small subunit